MERFAIASGDRNPLHADESFARRTPYGRCIAQGALVTISALGAAEADTIRFAKSLDMQFKQPIFPDETYDVRVADPDRNKTRIEVTGGGKVSVAITIATERELSPLAAAAVQQRVALPSSPRLYALEDFPPAGLSISEPYACDVDALRGLAEDLGATSVPDSVLVWLAAASYTVGMVVPGHDALFAGGRIGRSSTTGPGTLVVAARALDDRTGLIMVDATLVEEEAPAEMTLQTFLRPPVPAPTRSSVGRYISPSSDLIGRNVLVVGGSRGLGAALCGAFATQGATVWAAYSRSEDQVEELRREFGADEIRALRFDAEDAEEAKRAFETMRRDANALDGVVFSASPPLYETALGPEASAGTLRYLSSSLALVLVSLAESLEMVSRDGWIVVISSSALDDPPRAWPHHVIAKSALEGAAGYCARHHGVRVLIARPPKMLTDSMNSPMGRIGTVETEKVAAAIARWTIGRGAAGELALLDAEELSAVEVAGGAGTRPRT